MWWRRLREPSVSWLPYVFSSPSAWTMRTRAQSASISSATTMGIEVRTPVPISERCALMVTVPSRSIETKASGLLTTPFGMRSEEHTSELQSLMRLSYAVFCSKKQITIALPTTPPHNLDHKPTTLSSQDKPNPHSYKQ